MKIDKEWVLDAAKREDGCEVGAGALANNPPFDSKACPMCPVEIRNLHAVAHNYLNAVEHSSTDRITRKLAELRRAVEATQPLVDAHFADSVHAHGRVSKGDKS